MVSVAALLAARADDDRPGLRSADDGRAWTWREVVAECAVRVTHRKMAVPGEMLAERMLSPESVVYCPMPLFHSGAVMAAYAPALAAGAELVLRARFSASGLLPDVRAHGCTYKIRKRRLAKDGWRTDDPVWWRPGRDLAYRRMTAANAAGLRAEFEWCGRLHLLEGSG